jgi:hypothetical protein
MEIDAEVELDFSFEGDDSIEEISHMQTNSLSTCFNIGTDYDQAAGAGQSANQDELSLEPKRESDTEETIVKLKPGTQPLVITADRYLSEVPRGQHGI